MGWHLAFVWHGWIELQIMTNKGLGLTSLEANAWSNNCFFGCVEC